MRELLLVLDRRHRPQAALKRALRMHKDGDYKLTAVSFVWQDLASNSHMFDTKQRREIKRQIVSSHKAWLKELQEQHPELAEIKFVWGNHIASWLFEHAHAFDAVVKSADGRGRNRSALDWTLLNQLPIDLYLVGHRRVRQPKIVMAAIDLAHTDTAHKQLNLLVLNRAQTIATESNAELHVVNAVDISPVLIDLDIVNERAAKTRAQAQSKKALEKLLQNYKVPNRQRHFPVGRLGQALADCVKEVGADVLVVGTRTHRVKQALGLGNSAQRIMRKAPCDLLAIRPKQH